MELKESVARAILALLLVLALALVAATGGDEAYWRNRDTWAKETKEAGTWVMW